MFTLELEWMRELVTLRLDVKKTNSGYQIVVDQMSRLLNLTEKELHRRALACGWCDGGGERHVPDRRVVIEDAKEGDVLTFLASIQAIAKQKQSGTFSYCDRAFFDHTVFFSGKVILALSTEHVAHGWQLSREHLWEQTRECGIRYAGDSLSESDNQRALQDWSSMLVAISRFIRKQLGHRTSELMVLGNPEEDSISIGWSDTAGRIAMINGGGIFDGFMTRFQEGEPEERTRKKK